MTADDLALFESLTADPPKLIDWINHDDAYCGSGNCLAMIPNLRLSRSRGSNPAPCFCKCHKEAHDAD